MKILLCAINAKYIHTNIAVRLIQQYCENKVQSDIQIAEYTINNYVDDILSEIYEKSPDLIAFSCYIWNIEMVKKLVSLLKIVLPDLKIILGGPEVSYNSEKLMEDISEVDCIIKGEGEKTALRLFSAIEKREPIYNIDGITFRKNNEIISNIPSQPIDMSELPFPYKDLSEADNKICYYEASRGCPFNCQYCLSSIEKKVRFSPIEKVKKELRQFIDKKVKQVKFVDRTFNANNKFAIEIIRFIIQNDNGITNFHFEIAAELVTSDMISVLSVARQGLFQLEIGVQSTNSITLSEISRSGEFDKIKRVVEEIKSFKNIHIHLDLIAGLPYEGIESFISSYNDVYNLQPHQLQLGFLKVLHGSGIEKMCDLHAIKYSPYAPYEVLSTSVLSYDEILELKRVEDMTERYYNSNRFVHTISYINGFFDSPYDMYKSLSDVYKSFIQSISHNKNDAYKFILYAAKKFDFINEDEYKLVKWCLKFDYILHEKPRGTPEWTQECLNIYDKNMVYEYIVRRNIMADYFKDIYGIDPKECANLTHIEKMPINPVTFESEDTIVLVNYNNRDLYGNAQYIILDSDFKQY